MDRALLPGDLINATAPQCSPDSQDLMIRKSLAYWRARMSGSLLGISSGMPQRSLLTSLELPLLWISTEADSMGPLLRDADLWRRWEKYDPTGTIAWPRSHQSHWGGAL